MIWRVSGVSGMTCGSSECAHSFANWPSAHVMEEDTSGAPLEKDQTGFPVSAFRACTEPSTVDTRSSPARPGLPRRGLSSASARLGNFYS